MPKPVSGGEWLELHNETNSNVNLKNWSLFDAVDNGGIVSEIDIILTPGNFLIISKDSETVNLLNLEPSVQVIIPPSWTPMNNDGDHLTLLNANNIIVDEIEYSSEACRVAGRSWERIDYHRSGLESNNWGTCADLRGHTAGQTEQSYGCNTRH
ncbi:lamin tail domain-containing protein [bacterium]|nr:lamin tail domain-containing protein [bacterium]